MSLTLRMLVLASTLFWSDSVRLCAFAAMCLFSISSNGTWGWCVCVCVRSFHSSAYVHSKSMLEEPTIVALEKVLPADSIMLFLFCLFISNEIIINIQSMYHTHNGISVQCVTGNEERMQVTNMFKARWIRIEQILTVTYTILNNIIVCWFYLSVRGTLTVQKKKKKLAELRIDCANRTWAKHNDSGRKFKWCVIHGLRMTPHTNSW